MTTRFNPRDEWAREPVTDNRPEWMRNRVRVTRRVTPYVAPAVASPVVVDEWAAMLARWAR
jgi:hypothetical protein